VTLARDPDDAHVFSRKWWASRVTALTGLVTMWITTGSWDTEESVMLLTIVSAAAISWLVPPAGATE
jgi:hypothetical protein